jgi:hypothetical protein
MNILTSIIFYAILCLMEQQQWFTRRKMGPDSQAVKD